MASRLLPVVTSGSLSPKKAANGPPILSNFTNPRLFVPIARHGFILIANVSISALLRKGVHSLRLMATILDFCCHLGSSRDEGQRSPSHRGAGRELTLGGL